MEPVDYTYWLYKGGTKHDSENTSLAEYEYLSFEKR
jgi:hypothetical protein